MTLHDLFDRQLLGNTLSAWGLATGGVLGALLLITWLRGSVVRYLEALSARTENSIDDYAVALIKAIRPPLIIAVVLAIAMRYLELAERYDRPVRWLLVVAMVWQAFTWVNKSVDFWVTRYERKHTGTVDRAAVSILSFGARLSLWFLILLEVLHYFNRSPTTLLAGLGVSGIALALAVQNVLGDLLAAVAILFDKPFVVGDVIAVDNLEGTVERIGLKTTRLKATGGEQLIFSNADLMRSRMRNLTRRVSRRITIPLTLAPDTPVAQLNMVPRIIAEIVRADPRTVLLRSHLVGVGSAGFDFETVLLFDRPDASTAFNTRETVLLGILERFEQSGIRLAQPAAMPAPAPLRTDIAG